MPRDPADHEDPRSAIETIRWNWLWNFLFIVLAVPDRECYQSFHREPAASQFGVHSQERMADAEPPR
jgi:hypothetical protein